MKKILFILLSLIVITIFIPIDVVWAKEEQTAGKIVVANKDSGTLSVIDTISDDLIGTYDLPADDNPSEPMYVVYVSAKNRIFVGDRANDRLVVFSASDFSVHSTIEVGSGVFHMWADPQNKQLWVNNDIDNTTTVINPKTLEVIATVPTPEDLIEQGGKPHDVILDPFGSYAYVTVYGISGEYDYVVQFSTDTFEEVGRAQVGKDPHVSLARQNNLIYVTCQNSNVVVVLNRETMDKLTEIIVPGAHGAEMARNGKVFYTTNVPGGELIAIDTETNTVIGEAIDTPYPIPHNIALTPNSHKLYVTHSGASANKVTVYSISNKDHVPVFTGEITVGLNPFGLAYVP